MRFCLNQAGQDIVRCAIAGGARNAEIREELTRNGFPPLRDCSISRYRRESAVRAAHEACRVSIWRDLLAEASADRVARVRQAIADLASAVDATESLLSLPGRQRTETRRRLRVIRQRYNRLAVLMGSEPTRRVRHAVQSESAPATGQEAAR